MHTDGMSYYICYIIHVLYRTFICDSISECFPKGIKPRVQFLRKAFFYCRNPHVYVCSF